MNVGQISNDMHSGCITLDIQSMTRQEMKSYTTKHSVDRHREATGAETDLHIDLEGNKNENASGHTRTRRHVAQPWHSTPRTPANRNHRTRRHVDSGQRSMYQDSRYSRRKLCEEYSQLQSEQMKNEVKIAYSEKELYEDSKLLDEFHADYEHMNRKVTDASRQKRELQQTLETRKQEKAQLRIEHLSYVIGGTMLHEEIEDMSDKIGDIGEDLVAFKEINRMGKDNVKAAIKTLEAKRKHEEEKNKCLMMEVEKLKKIHTRTQLGRAEQDRSAIEKKERKEMNIMRKPKVHTTGNKIQASNTSGPEGPDASERASNAQSSNNRRKDGNKRSSRQKRASTTKSEQGRSSRGERQTTPLPMIPKTPKKPARKQCQLPAKPEPLPPVRNGSLGKSCAFDIDHTTTVSTKTVHDRGTVEQNLVEIHSKAETSADANRVPVRKPEAMWFSFAPSPPAGAPPKRQVRSKVAKLSSPKRPF